MTDQDLHDLHARIAELEVELIRENRLRRAALERTDPHVADKVVAERDKLQADNERLRDALREIATADFCASDSWTDHTGTGCGYLCRATCCLERTSRNIDWCIICVAANALGWDRDKFVLECGGAKYLCDDERAALGGAK